MFLNFMHGILTHQKLRLAFEIDVFKFSTDVKRSVAARHADFC